MTKEFLKELFIKTKNKYGTNPNDLVKSLGLGYVSSDLGEMYGYYAYFSPRQRGIGINSNLEDHEKTLTTFHEVSHDLLQHRGKVFANYGTIESAKEERDADLLATYFFLDYYGLDIKSPETFEGIILPNKIHFYTRVLLEA